jgi:MOSC domain-containing protein YiiM/SAM-dependent methyltransferase
MRRTPSSASSIERGRRRRTTLGAVAIHESAAKGFAAGVDAYERGRPSYSPEAIAHIVRELRIGLGSRVLDLAAGTGKLTRELVPTGAEMIAVEPIAEMRTKLEAAVPTVKAIAGTAEDIPLANHSVDAVVVGQAFHWFDGIRATSELRRVLRPDGALALIWQSREASVPWVARLNEIIDRADDGHPRFRTDQWRETFDLTAIFDPLEKAVFAYDQRITPDLLVDRVASISYVAAMRGERRHAVLDEVRELIATDPATAGRTEIVLPHRVDVFVTRPRAVPTGPSTGVLLSVNTSPGGVPKRPIGSGHMGLRGVNGDGHDKPEPIHGTAAQAACLYAFEAIERIRAEGHQAFPGAYGENFTLAGLDWTSLRRGDRLRIGSGGPLLQLTDYATPCSTQAQWFVGERYGRISHRAHPEDARWYAAVLEEGSVAAGDEVRLIRTA